PSAGTSTSAGLDINNQAGPIVAGFFHGPRQPFDLAILMEDRGEVWVYTGHADGSFTLGQRISVGRLATGLSVVAGGKPCLFDLLVGNEFGDILIIRGKGNGTFMPFTRVDQAVPFVTIDHNGRQDVILANQATDVAKSEVRQPGSKTFAPGNFTQQGNG